MSSIYHVKESLPSSQRANIINNFWPFANEARASNFQIIPPHGPTGDLITELFCYDQNPFFQAQMPAIYLEAGSLMPHAERGSAFTLPSTSSIVRWIGNGGIVAGGAITGVETPLKGILAQSDALFREIRKQAGDRIFESRNLKQFEKIARNNSLYKSLQEQLNGLPTVLKNKWGIKKIDARAIRHLCLDQDKIARGIKSSLSGLKAGSRSLFLVSGAISSYEIFAAGGGKENYLRVAASEAIGLGLGIAAGYFGMVIGGAIVSIAAVATGFSAPIWVTALVIGVTVIGLGFGAERIKTKINDMFIGGKYAD